MPNKRATDMPDPIDVFVGSRVRSRRLGRRLSQGKLGESIGVTFQQVQKYENGINRISASNLYKIAMALGVDVSYFFEGMENEPGPNSKGGDGGLSDHLLEEFESSRIGSREAADLLHFFFRIEDPKLRKSVQHFLISLSKLDGSS